MNRPEKLTWEQAVLWLREQPGREELVREAYYDDPLLQAAQRYANGAEWQAVRALLPAQRPAAALDVGAGRGIVSYALALDGFSVTALEPDDSAIVGANAIHALARDSGVQINVVQTFSEQLPFADASFDVLIARAVLHHTRNLESACREFFRVLHPGGRLLALREHVISRPADLQRFFALHPLHHLYGGENAFELPRYTGALRDAGFQLSAVLGPLDSEINLAPQTPRSFVEETVKRVFGRAALPRRVFGALLGNRLTLAPDPSRHRAVRSSPGSALFLRRGARPMNDAWVTGARGFIGRAVAHRTAAEGARVSGLGHGAWSAPAAAASGLHTWVNGVISASNLHALASAGLPTTIYHLAGGSSVGAAIAQPREDFARTVESTAELLEWVRQESPRTRVVVVSSAAVYGAGHGNPIGESAPTNPFSPYGAHKLMMETMCRSYGASFGIESVIARVFSAYGPGLRKQLLWDTCSKLDGGGAQLELGGDGTELRDYVHVHDLANIIVALRAHASADAPVVNVGSGRGTPVRELTSLLLEAWSVATGKPAAALKFNGRGRTGDPRYLVANNSLLRSLGLKVTVPLDRGVREYVDWFRHRQTEAD